MSELMDVTGQKGFREKREVALGRTANYILFYLNDIALAFLTGFSQLPE